MKILVIDDDDLVRYTLRKILCNAGHVVSCAPDGRRGISVLRTEHPEVVITDIFMPEQEGFETIRQIRQDHPGTKMIAISGGFRGGNMDVWRIASALGADDVIAKPFEADDLLRRLDRLQVTVGSGAVATPASP